MNNNESSEKQLQEILSTKAFDKLESFIRDDNWRSLQVEDLRKLARLLTLQGEELLLQGDNKAFDVFSKAHEVSPQDPSLYFAQGVLLSGISGNSLCFTKADECFSLATSLDPEFFDAWFTWAKVLLEQGGKLEDEALVCAAEALFSRARECCPGDLEIEASLYWFWGMADSLLGRFHGEAVDFKKALRKFAIAASLGQCHAEFWELYGQVTCELGGLVNNPEALLEGRDHFFKAIQSDPENKRAWLNLALCCQKLYEVYGKPEDFELASQVFEQAERFNQNEGQFWCRWGILLFLYGSQAYSVDSLNESFEKFKMAHAAEPDNPQILAKWAEAEMAYGIYKEKIDYLRRAEQKIINCLKMQSDNVDAWYIYGSCLNEIGRYFNDLNYYKQAAEKFEYGLSLDPDDALMLQGISFAYYSIGEITNDSFFVEQSIRYIEKAIESSKAPLPQLWNDLGVSLMKMAEFTSERTYLEQAIEKFEYALSSYDEDDPESIDPEWLYNCGCALDFLGGFHEDPVYYEKSIKLLLKFLEYEPPYLHAHYNLASSYSHLGELVGDVDCFHKAIEHYQRFLSEDNEDELVWTDYGLTLLNLAELLQDPSLPNLSQVCFNQAEEKFQHAISLGSRESFYHLACLHSLMEHYPQAIYYMEKAEQQKSLPHINEIMDEPRLENLLNTAEFKNFLAETERKRNNP